MTLTTSCLYFLFILQLFSCMFSWKTRTFLSDPKLLNSSVYGMVHRQSRTTKGKPSTSRTLMSLLPDKLNTFYSRFEDNTVPPTRPATKDCGLSFSLAGEDVSKIFKCVYRHIQSLPIPVCCPHLLQDVHHCSCTQESKGN